MEELKKLFFEYLKALEEANKADEAWEKDPCNQEKERAFDETYKKEFDLYQRLSHAIVDISLGQISKGTAASMINGRFEDLEKIIEKIA